MAYRKIETVIWKDPWFLELDPEQKLVFLYLWTNDTCNQAGCYQISLRVISFETGLSLERVKEVMGSLSPKVKYYPPHNTVWVCNFTKHQAQNNSFWESAVKLIEDFPQEIQRDWLAYYKRQTKDMGGSTPPPTPHQGGFTSTEQNRTEQKQKKDIPPSLISLSQKFIEHQHKAFPKLLKEVSDKMVQDGADTLRKLVEIDKYDLETEIKPLLRWLVQDAFWADKVLSPVSLRKKSSNGNTKFVNALASMNGNKPNKTKVKVVGGDPEWY